MKKLILIVLFVLLLIPAFIIAQTNQWSTQYVTLDEAGNGTGDRTSSIAVVGPNSFVALVSRITDNNDIFGTFDNNYLVGYFEADSALGRVAEQDYGPIGQFEGWISGLDQVLLSGAWQIAGGNNSYVYVANNDGNHNILVFELTGFGVLSTDFRMESGSENIFAIDVDTSGYVYVVDYEGSDAKNNEVKIFSPVGADGTTWGDAGGHTDAPSTTIDLPPGIYQGVAASGDGSQIFVSSINTKSVLKYVGDPVNGYSQDNSFSAVISPTDTYLDEGGLLVGSTTFLGMDYLDNPGLLFAAVDSFLCGAPSECGGYATGRIFAIDPATGTSIDTIDVAQWNFDVTNSYSTGSSNGRVGGFTSVYDVDVSGEPAVYTQTFYGWAIEKWIFDGDLATVVSVEQVAETIPTGFSLHQNYPNPFNPITTIEFEIQSSEHVILSIFDLKGQIITTLVDEQLPPGIYRSNFDAGKFASGIYFYSIQAGQIKSTKKMILVK